MQRPADLEALLHHAEWLQRLAAPLLAQTAEAEDVVQETWLAALEHPPRRDSNWPAWLARVAGLRARRARRDAQRRVAREARGARPESAASTEEIAARVEIESKLAQHVLALEPNQQRAILLRYYEDLPPREIAKRLAVPLATVKSWLRRALECLRVSLAGELGVDWRRAFAPLVPIAGSPTLAAPAGAALLALTSLLGGILLHAKLFAGIALLVALGTWTTLREGSASRDPDPRGAASKVAPASASGTREGENELADARVVRASGDIAWSSGAASQDPVPREFVVQVVDHEGRARPDAAVVLVASVWRDSNSTSHGHSRPYRPREGDVEALIHIPRKDVAHEIAQIRRQEERAGARIRHELWFKCAIVGSPPVRHVFESDVPPAGVIRMQMPPLGRVRIEAVDEAGALRALPLQFVLAPSLTRKRTWDTSMLMMRGEEQQTRNGFAEFPFVALDRELELLVIADELAAQAVLVHGPIAADQELLVRVPLVHPMPVVTGRVIDALGAPLAQRTIGVTALVDGRGRGTRLTSDDEGRFSLRWSHDYWSEKPCERFGFDLVEMKDEHDERVLATHVIPAPPIPETGTVDLGVIALLPSERGALVLEGTVVDGEGRPVEGAQLDFYAIWPLSSEGPWEEHRSIGPATSDAEGHFAVHATQPCRGVRVGARHPGHYLASPELFAAGRSDVQLLLRHGATLRGQVLLDPEVPPSDVRALVRDGRRILAGAELSASREFELTGLPPNRLAFELGVPFWPSLRIEDFAIEGAGEVQDPRIQTIDLRGKLRRWPLRIEAPRPLERERRSCRLFDPARPESAISFIIDREGRRSAWIPSSAEAVVFAAFDYPPQLVSWSAAEQIVKLEPGITLRIERTDAEALPPGIELRVALAVPENSTLSPFARRCVATSAIELESGRSAILRPPVAGSYGLRWSMRSAINGRSVDLAEQPIVVTPEPREQTMRVSPPQAEIENALAALREKS